MHVVRAQAQAWTDAALVEGLRRGDPSAFDVAYERHRAAVFGFVLRMTGQQQVAEELLQETWLRLARHAPRLREDTHLRGWLFTVARNLVRSHQRWAWLDGTRLLELAGARPSPPPSPLEHAEADQAAARLESALARMAPSHREVVLLVVVERLEPSEAAAVLGIKPEALRQRLARARAQLADALPEGAS